LILATQPTECAFIFCYLSLISPSNNTFSFTWDIQRHCGREGLGAGQIADEIIADEEAAIPGISVERTSLTVGGEDAVVLEVDGWRIRLFCENIPEIVISMKNRILKTSRGAWIIGFHSLIGVRLAGIEQFIL
jgi:hypothetical protein